MQSQQIDLKKEFITIKKAIIIVLCLTVFLSLGTTALAVGTPTDFVQVDSFNSIFPGIRGESLHFSSVDDETGIANSGLPIQTRQASGIIWSKTWYQGSAKVVEKATATGDALLEEQFVKYLTSSWAKASSYTWSQTNTASWSISSGADATVASAVRVSLGLSASRSTSYSTAVTIEADSSKYSKLGFASDYFKQNYTYTMTVDGTVARSENSYIKTPTIDTYVNVYYK